MRIMEPLCRKLLLCKEEGWKITTSTRLQTNQQMDHEELKCLPTNSPSYRQIMQMHPLYKSQRPMGI